MTNLIDKRTQLRILKKNNKFKYKFYILHLKSGKYILLLFLLLMLYFTIRYFKLKYSDENEEAKDTMADINYKKNYDTYSIKNGSKLSENNYLEKYSMQKQTRVTPVPNKVIQYY
jgi:hypothetical protein